MMKITRVEEGNILLLTFREGKVASTKEPHPEIFVDLDADGNVLEIEVIGASGVSAEDLLKVFERFGLDQKLVVSV